LHGGKGVIQTTIPHSLGYIIRLEGFSFPAPRFGGMTSWATVYMKGLRFVILAQRHWLAQLRK